MKTAKSRRSRHARRTLAWAWALWVWVLWPCHAHPLLGDAPSLRAHSAVVSAALRQLRSCLQGADAHPKVVLHAFDWEGAAATGAAQALLQGEKGAWRLVTHGEPPPAVRSVSVRAGGLYVLALPKVLEQVARFCGALAKLRLKDPYALYVALPWEPFAAVKQSWAIQVAKYCSSANGTAISPLAVRFATLFIIQSHSSFKTRILFVRYFRNAMNNMFSYIVGASVAMETIESFCAWNRSINSIDDHKNWAWRWRNLKLSHSYSRFERDRWENKDNVPVLDGPDICALITFIKRAPSSRNEAVPGMNFNQDNGTLLGPIGSLQVQSSHICASSFMFLTSVSKFADYTVPTVQNDVCILVRKALRVPYSLVLLLPYEPLVWLCLGVTLFLSGCVWFTVRIINFGSGKKCSDKLQFFDGCIRSIIEVIETIVTGSTYLEVSSPSKRVFLGSLLLFSVVITNAYSGKLLSFFTTPVYYVDINTLEEVADKIEVVHTFLNVLNPSADGDISDSIKAIERRAKSMPAVDKMGNNQVDQAKLFLKEIRERGKGAIILQKLVIPFFSQLPDEESGNGKYVAFYLVPECLVSPGFEAPTVAKGDAILEVANAFFSRLVEGGFYEQWRALQWHKMAANGVTRPLGSAGARKTAPKPLAREQLAGPFLLLSIGLALAAVALAAELLCRPASLSKPSHFLLHWRRHAWE